MTRQRDLEFSDVVARRFPLMHEAIAQIGHRQTRNRGTIGGSLCHLDPSAELVSCAMTLDAAVVVAGPAGEREIAFRGFSGRLPHVGRRGERSADRDQVRAWPADHGYAFIEFSRRHGDFAIVSAAVLLEMDAAGAITRAAVTLGGMGIGPVRAARARGGAYRQGAGRRVPARGLRKLPRLRGARRRPRAGILPPASRHGHVAARAGKSLCARHRPAPPAACRPHRIGHAMGQTRKIALTVNGKRYEEEVEVRVTLADFIRHQLGLTGTHLGCEHGVCGACTILLDGRSARSCLMLAVQADGHDIPHRRGHRAES